MELLNQSRLKTFTSAFLITAILASCAPGNTQTATVEQYLESDTYISSDSAASHGADSELLVSKSASREDRALVKLPTEANRSSESDLDGFLNQILVDPIATIILAPFLITAKMVSLIVGCQEDVLDPVNLTSSKLVFAVNSTEAGSLAGAVQIQALSKTFWSNASWTRAHSFSKSGKWSAGGGDLDSSFAPIASSVGAGTVEFDITNYMKSVLTSSQKAHYGLEVAGVGSSLGLTKLASVQSTATLNRPKIVSTYTAACTPIPSTSIQADGSREFTLGTALR